MDLMSMYEREFILINRSIAIHKLLVIIIIISSNHISHGNVIEVDGRIRAYTDEGC